MGNKKQTGETKPSSGPVTPASPQPSATASRLGRWVNSPGGIALMLFVILSVLFWRSFQPGKILFSNDSPLGVMAEECVELPASILGVWVDLNWLGSEGVGPSPSVTGFLRLLTSPIFYSKYYCPIALFLLGLGAWYCFRKMKLSPVACVLGALAAALNSDFFSTSCWGVESQMVAVGTNYVALGFLAGTTGRRRWIGLILAGLAVGMNIMEAYDIGALFSLFVAAFVVYQALFLDGNGTVKVGKRLATGVMRTAIVAICAALLAVFTISTLVGTQIKGMEGMAQDAATRQRRWNDATVWSLPKAEVLQVAVPGLFGYRMEWQLYDAEQPGRDAYWGTVGANPPGWWRFSGTGYYAGVAVVLIALWTVAQSLRKKGSVFPLMQKRIIWFWAAVSLLSLLMAFGKYAPFYQFFYALPYASTIRNPTKFMHVFSWSLMIIFAFGVHGLYVGYMQNPVARVEGVMAQFKAWRARAAAFDRKWINGCMAVIGVSILAFLIYASAGQGLQAYMKTVGIGGEITPGVDRAAAMAGYSIMSIGWFVLLLAAATVWLAAVFSGQFSGVRANWAAVSLGALLVFDLGRADMPWMAYWDAKYKYYLDDNYQSKNPPIISDLADKRYEHRVAAFPYAPRGDEEADRQMAILQNTYQLDWKQALFMYNNIQTLEVVQEPRVSVEKTAFLGAIPPVAGPRGEGFPLVLRHWELTNTRYLIGKGGQPWLDAINQQLDAGRNRFRILKSFDFVPRKKEFSPLPVDYVPEIKTNGQLALIEFTGALPRAKLFSNWELIPDGNAALGRLASASFDPHQAVVVAEGVAAPDPANVAKDPGTVEIKNYSSRRIEMEADVKTPAVLLHCDRYYPKWQVSVDGKPEKMLRCNYIARGVYLMPGKHTVVFEFVGSPKALYVSLAVLAIGLLMWVGLEVTGRRADSELAKSAGPAQKPA